MWLFLLPFWDWKGHKRTHKNKTHNKKKQIEWQYTLHCLWLNTDQAVADFRAFSLNNLRKATIFSWGLHAFFTAGISIRAVMQENTSGVISGAISFMPRTSSRASFAPKYENMTKSSSVTFLLYSSTDEGMPSGNKPLSPSSSNFTFSNHSLRAFSCASPLVLTTKVKASNTCNTLRTSLLSLSTSNLVDNNRCKCEGS